MILGRLWFSGRTARLALNKGTPWIWSKHIESYRHLADESISKHKRCWWPSWLVLLLIGVLSAHIILGFSKRQKDRTTNNINYMGVSINGGTPKWMVYKGKSHLSWWLVVPHFRKPPYMSILVLSFCRKIMCKCRISVATSVGLDQEWMMGTSLTHWCFVGNGGMGWLSIVFMDHSRHSLYV